MKLDLAVLEQEIQKLPEDKRREAEEYARAISKLYEQNPLERFHACERDCGIPGCVQHPRQREFLYAKTPIQAAFAGNRFGKSTSLVVKSLAQLLPDDWLPDRLKPVKQRDAPTYGRIVCPSFDHAMGVILPTFREWTPPSSLLGGSFDRAWDKTRRILRFDSGSWVQVMTYEQDVDKFGGAALDFVGYDEPPPEDIRNECRMRLVDRAGFEMFAMTPLMGIGWLYRAVWKQRSKDHITVVRGSIHDNPTLDAASIERVLQDYPEDHPERRSREHGEFAHFGGMVYPNWRDHVVDPPSKEEIQGKDVVVGIDPGYKAAGFVWIAFDEENRALVFHEAYVHKGNVLDFVRAIRKGNADWEVSEPLYVMDPYHGHKHSMTDGATVAEEFARQGIYTCNPAVLDKDHIVYGQIQQVWRRMAEGAFKVSRDCTRLCEEAEEYRVEDRPDGVFQVVKEFDEGLDCVRYACSWRPWYADQEEQPAPEFWEPGRAPSQDWLTGRHTAPPMGVMS